MGGVRETAARPRPVPASFQRWVEGRRWRRDRVGEAGAVVHRLVAPGEPDLFLKVGRGEVADQVADEWARLRWLGRHMRAPRPLAFLAEDEGAWLLTTAAPGRTAWQVLDAEPARRGAVVRELAAGLRRLHAIRTDLCPFDSRAPVRLAAARARLEAGKVDTDDFGAEHAGWTAEAVWEEMLDLKPLAFHEVVTHGDFSLDNLLLDEAGRLTGLIDLGLVGVADPWQDLAILWCCLGEFEPALQAELLTAYGVACDERKLRFHLCLDEFF